MNSDLSDPALWSRIQFGFTLLDKVATDVKVMMKRITKIMNTVADQFAEIVAISGVKRIYGVVGDSLNGITDSIRRQGKIE
jgi:hypothetical protein